MGRARELLRYARLYGDARAHYGYPNDRHDVACRLLERHKVLPVPDLLDVSAGRGQFARAIQPRAADVNVSETSDLLLDNELAEFMPFRWVLPNPCPVLESWELVTCLDTLEHLLPADTEAAVRELGRIAHRWLLVSMDLTSCNWPDYGELHINRRTETEWRQLLTNTTGFHLRAEERIAWAQWLLLERPRVPAVVLGNGPSRTKVDVDMLRGELTVFGCNLAYREYPWLSAVGVIDPRVSKNAALELASLHEAPQVVENYRDCHNCGAMMVSYALDMGYDPVYLVGFDLTGQSLYDDDPAYLNKPDRQKGHRADWQEDLDALQHEYPLSRIVQVGDAVQNMRSVTYEELLDESR